MERDGSAVDRQAGRYIVVVESNDVARGRFKLIEASNRQCWMWESWTLVVWENPRARFAKSSQFRFRFDSIQGTRRRDEKRDVIQDGARCSDGIGPFNFFGLLLLVLPNFRGSTPAPDKGLTGYNRSGCGFSGLLISPDLS